MGLTITSDIILLPTLESVSLTNHQHMASSLTQFVGNNDVSMEFASDDPDTDDLLTQTTEIEMYPYTHQGEAHLSTKYHVEIFDADYRLKYSDDFLNLVTTEGLNHVLDATFKTGVASPTWYIGLVNGASTPTYAAGNTALSHTGWTEFTGYSDTYRQTFTPGTISGGAVDNVQSRAVFHINGSGTVAGCFLISDHAISGTAGVLHGVGTFVAGARDVQDGDILRISTTVSADAS
jgi:hypothetical protein